ncbi:uncharacterized protein LOC141830081 [Curcuma longa]|uniref:uncharacterized protein LOC141830081 n=1 Tax=Curcuma longa TaxID=136217 RepID=UPI003D9ECD6D
MASVAEDSQEVGSKGMTQTTRSKRGRTQMNKLAVQRVQGVKQSVRFNEYGQPVGQKASELQSFIGVLAREKVNINYHSWKQVPDEVKNMIWESVNLTYKMDPKWRNGCLSSANAKWRQYKTHLTRTFIRPNRNNPKLLNKVPQGHCISPKDWSSFVISRMSEDFIKKSELQSERGKANLYPHRLSRKGYAGLSQEIVSI